MGPCGFPVIVPFTQSDLWPYFTTHHRKGRGAMTIRIACAYLIMASGILFATSCSLMIDQPKGGVPSESGLRSESKSLAGVYTDLDSNGSIKPHPQVVGEGGRINGLIILSAPADMLDIKTGAVKLKESTDTTPTVRMGESTFRSRSGTNSPDSSKNTPDAGNK